MIVNPKSWFLVSIVTIIVSMAVIFTIGPLWGIDFVGGSLTEVTAKADDADTIRDVLLAEFELPATIQTTPEGSLIIRTRALSPETHDQIKDKVSEEGLIAEELRFESIGPTIGQGLRQKAWIAMGMVVAAMIIYLAYTFRGAKGLISPWKFGVAAAYALLHDLTLITALFVIFGKLWDVPIDTLFVTAQLAIIGYSVNDTIVLFNRMKSEWVATRSDNLLSIIDKATRATLVRSLNTSLTTLLVLVTLLIFGGTTLRWFIVALALGTIVGTYSSIFVASPMLYRLSRK